MLKILFLTQYYPPEVNAPANRVSELAREWARAGNEVTVLTGFPIHPKGIKRPEDRGVLTRDEEVDGVRVKRVYLWAAINQGVVRRMLSYASFMVSSFLFGIFFCTKPDIVIATSPQLLTAASGYALSFRFRVPFIFEVRDLWPESILAVRVMKDNLVVRILKGLANFLYKKADIIVAVGPGYRRKIMELYRVDSSKFRIIENGVDGNLFRPRPKDSGFLRAEGWEGKKVLLYAGTHGMAQGLNVVLEAADRLKDRHDLLFVLVGEGAEKKFLVKKAAEMRLDNVRFYPQQSRDILMHFYANCDLGLVHLRDTPLFEEVLPSKIFEYLAMERPVLIGVGGEARILVARAKGGVYFRPENSGALAWAFESAVEQPGRLRDMGASGRAYTLQHYDRSALAHRYLSILKEVSNRRNP